MAAGGRQLSVEALIARYGLAALFVGAGVEGETVVVAGGLLAHEGYFPLPAAMAAAASGSFVADQLFFTAGRRFREHRWIARVRAKPAFERALGFIERYPTGFIFAFRFLYGLRTVSPIAIGTTRVPTGRFLIVNAAAAIVWGITFSAIGYLFGHAFTMALHRLKPTPHELAIGAGALAAVALTAIVTRWIARRRA